MNLLGKVLLGVTASLPLVSGHGYLADPPARNSMWRRGFTNPVNYNDNELYCGGYITQQKNDGKCGVCGDNWTDKEPRPHEAGGDFGNGIIGRRYVMGQKIDIEIELSANHKGYFELKLCPVNDRTEEATQECLDAHPLYLVDNPSSYKYFIPKDKKKTDVCNYQVYLPQGVTCSQCVIQWRYVTGNTWGSCEDGSFDVGCGPQENFVNCADVQIYSNAIGLPPNAVDNPNAIYFRDSSAPGGRRQMIVKHTVCVPRGIYANTPNMAEWCQQNCLRYGSNCDPSKCICLKECEAKGELSRVEGTDVFCHINCLRYPSTCPRDKCRCFSEDGVEAWRDVDNDLVEEEDVILDVDNKKDEDDDLFAVIDA